MLVQIVTENGQKKVIPLTADAGAGAPVGTIIAMYKKSNPSGYLYCDGSTFDETKYPLLYAYLGSNELPDYREFALVGAEQNTTDVYNASTNPTGTIHDHDVFTEGQAKDDQLQDHNHKIPNNNQGNGANGGSNTNGVTNLYNSIETFEVNGARKGTVTRGKRKAVYFYIKATSGLSENAQDNVVALLNEERSYSTEEVNTGKKWIDGKPIYRKVFTGTIGSTSFSESISIPNVEKIIRVEPYLNTTNLSIFPSFDNGGGYYFALFILNGTALNIRCHSDYVNRTYTAIVEYTKTTDV